jgi:hypothetical protein
MGNPLRRGSRGERTGETIMKRITLGAGTLVLGLAALLWATAALDAQHGRGGGGHGGGGHAPAGHAPAGHAPAAHAPAGRAPARLGSVHYGARAAPARVAHERAAPGVRAGAVRAEHYAHADHGHDHRNPYRDDYARHFRPGFRTFLLGDALYDYYDTLPGDCQPVVNDDGSTYYLCDGVYYEPYVYGGQTVYLVVPN